MPHSNVGVTETCDEVHPMMKQNDQEQNDLRVSGQGSTAGRACSGTEVRMATKRYKKHKGLNRCVLCLFVAEILLPGTPNSYRRFGRDSG